MAAQLWWVTAATAQWMAGWLHNCNEQHWLQWGTAGVTMGDRNCGGTIPMGNNSGGTMDSGRVVQS